MALTAPKGRILVIRGGAIGDFILTLPVLRALRAQFPQTHLEVLGYAHIAQLAVAGGLAHGVRSIEAASLAAFFAPGASLKKEWTDYFASFSIILSYLYDPDFIFQTNIARSAKVQFIAGPHRVDESKGEPASKQLLQPLERLAIFDPDPIPRLRWTTDDAAHLNSVERPIVGSGVAGCPGQRDAREGPLLAVHPGSGSETKNWPEHKWAELLSRLLENPARRLMVVGGEVEAGKIERLIAPLPMDRVERVQNLPLPELALRLERCAAFLGHDSGISHLAAALGVPSMLLWADTREDIWRPLGSHVEVLREDGGLANLTVSRVLDVIQARL